MCAVCVQKRCCIRQLRPILYLWSSICSKDFTQRVSHLCNSCTIITVGMCTDNHQVSLKGAIRVTSNTNCCCNSICKCYNLAEKRTRSQMCYMTHCFTKLQLLRVLSVCDIAFYVSGPMSH